MICLQMLLQVELDHVLLAAEVAVVHGARLPGDVHLDLLAGAEGRHGVDEGGDSLVGGPDVILDRVHCEELGGAVLALVKLVGSPVGFVITLDMVNFANLQRILLSAKPAKILDITVRMLSELMLNSHSHCVKTLNTNIAGNLGSALLIRNIL